MMWPLLWSAAVPTGLAAIFAAALWWGQTWDRATNAAAGFATYDQPTHAPWLDDQTEGDTP